MLCIDRVLRRGDFSRPAVWRYCTNYVDIFVYMDESDLFIDQLPWQVKRSSTMFGEQRESHEMVLDMIHPSGAEEWYCPTCGQRFLLKWPPTYNKVFLEAGNMLASHSGERVVTNREQEESDLNVESMPAYNDESIAEEERRLEPYLKWLEDIKLDNLWKS